VPVGRGERRQAGGYGIGLAGGLEADAVERGDPAHELRIEFFQRPVDHLPLLTGEHHRVHETRVVVASPLAVVSEASVQKPHHLFLSAGLEHGQQVARALHQGRDDQSAVVPERGQNFGFKETVACLLVHWVTSLSTAWPLSSSSNWSVAAMAEARSSSPQVLWRLGRHLRRLGTCSGHPGPAPALLDDDQHPRPELSAAGETQGWCLHRTGRAAERGQTHESTMCAGQFQVGYLDQFYAGIDTDYPKSLRHSVKEPKRSTSGQVGPVCAGRTAPSSGANESVEKPPEEHEHSQGMLFERD